MSPATGQLLRAVLTLPENERRELVEALLATQDAPGELPFDSGWLAEAQRRYAEVQAGAVNLIPWQVVQARARQRLENPPSG
jgi:putative addiction module component (TIGR02574 family)